MTSRTVFFWRFGLDPSRERFKGALVTQKCEKALNMDLKMEPEINKKR